MFQRKAGCRSHAPVRRNRDIRFPAMRREPGTAWPSRSDARRHDSRGTDIFCSTGNGGCHWPKTCSPKHCRRRPSFGLYASMTRTPRGLVLETADWKRVSFMISTTYASLSAINVANRQIYLPMLRVDKFAFFVMMVNLSAKTISS